MADTPSLATLLAHAQHNHLPLEIPTNPSNRVDWYIGQNLAHAGTIHDAVITARRLANENEDPCSRVRVLGDYVWYHHAYDLLFPPQSAQELRSAHYGVFAAQAREIGYLVKHCVEDSLATTVDYVKGLCVEPSTVKDFDVLFDRSVEPTEKLSVLASLGIAYVTMQEYCRELTRRFEAVNLDNEIMRCSTYAEMIGKRLFPVAQDFFLTATPLNRLRYAKTAFYFAVHVNQSKDAELFAGLAAANASEIYTERISSQKRRFELACTSDFLRAAIENLKELPGTNEDRLDMLQVRLTAVSTAIRKLESFFRPSDPFTYENFDVSTGELLGDYFRAFEQGGGTLFILDQIVNEGRE